MRKYFPYLLIILCLAVMPDDLIGQYSKKEAKKQLDQGNYYLALDLYEKYLKIEEDKEEIANRGIANYHANNVNLALKDFGKAKKLGNKEEFLDYYIAKAYHAKANYQSAIDFYRKYLKSLKKKNKMKQHIVNEIRRCGFALKHMNGIEPYGLVESFGDDVNTKDNEICPVPSANFSNKVYFTSDIANDFDVYSASLNGDLWMRKDEMNAAVNSSNDDLLQSLSPDGQVMFLLRNEDETQKLYYSTSNSNKANKFDVLDKYGARDIYFVDQNTILFSSMNKGGFGGYDIYISNYSNGSWSKPKNMGENINSSFDERSPFMTTDQKTIFFSSNGINSFGGFDVFKSFKSPDWVASENLGSPINSPGDDLFFKVSDSGYIASMSSNRKTGEGGYDIYQVFLKEQLSINKSDEALAFIKVPKRTFNEKQDQNEKSEDTQKPQIKEEVVVKKETPKKKKKEEKVKEVETVKIDHKEIEEEIVKTEQKSVEQKTTVVPDSPEEISEKEKKKIEEEALAEVQNMDKAIVPEREQTKTEAPKKTPRRKIERTKAGSYKADSKQDEIKTKEKSSPSVIKADEAYANIIITPLYFNDPDILLTDQNEKELDNIITILNKYPDSKLVLTSHCHNKGLIEFQLYRSLKYPEKIASYLEMNDIDLDRILLKSVASNYPVAKMSAASEVIDYNQKIDVSYINLPSNVVTEIAIPEMKSYEKDNRYEIYHTVVDELYYRVEITAQSNMYKNILLRNYVDLMVEKDTDTDKIKYMIGLYPTFQDAQNLKERLSDTNVPYAKIVAFYNGEEIDTEKAEELANKYPDLNYFLSYND